MSGRSAACGSPGFSFPVAIWYSICAAIYCRNGTELSLMRISTTDSIDGDVLRIVTRPEAE
ncbi:MAG: hypothetical protein JJE04_19580 [Acidobacteriia bacterium]|nr:hypothetical protein [Terriglobia bacterium]